MIKIDALRAPLKKARDDGLTEIERLAAKLEPALAKAILDLLTTKKDAVDLGALAAALKAGDTSAVIAMLSLGDLAAPTGKAVEALQGAVWGGGALAVGAVNAQLSGATFVFDRLNPRLVTWLQTYTLDLIRQVNDSTREAVRTSLITGMTSGASPIAVARNVKGSIGLTDRQLKAVANYRRELETFHMKRTAGGYNLGAKIDRVNNRQVFKPDEDGTAKDGIDQRRLRDFRFDGKLQAAMKSGVALKPEVIDKMVAGYERKYLRHRSETIARTEALRAVNFGVQDAWRQAIETGKASETLVRRRWVLAKDERTCEVCGAVPKMNHKLGVAFDQPFSTPKGPVMLPPLHPNCRCSIFIRAYEPFQLQ